MKYLFAAAGSIQLVPVKDVGLVASKGFVARHLIGDKQRFQLLPQRQALWDVSSQSCTMRVMQNMPEKISNDFQ